MVALDTINRNSTKARPPNNPRNIWFVTILPLVYGVRCKEVSILIMYQLLLTSSLLPFHLLFEILILCKHHFKMEE